MQRLLPVVGLFLLLLKGEQNEEEAGLPLTLVSGARNYNGHLVRAHNDWRVGRPQGPQAAEQVTLQPMPRA